MALHTFENTAADGDYSNFLNYDTLTVPSGAGDDLGLAAQGQNTSTLGSIQCGNIVDASPQQNTMNGGSITVYGTVTGVNCNGVNLTPGTGTAMTYVDCLFQIDPNNYTVVTEINTSADCEISVIFGSGSLVTLNGDGTEIYNTTEVNCHVVAPAIVGSNVTFNQSVTCNLINCPQCTFNAISQTGTARLVVGTLSGAVTWTSVKGLTGSPAINCAKSESWSGANPNVITYLLTGEGGTVSLTQPGGSGEPMIPIAAATVSVAAGSSPTKIQDVSTSDNKVSTLSLQVTAPSGSIVTFQVGVRVAASGNIVITRTYTDMGNYLISGQYPIPPGGTAVFAGIPIPNAVDSVVINALQSGSSSQNVTSSGSLA